MPLLLLDDSSCFFLAGSAGALVLVPGPGQRPRIVWFGYVLFAKEIAPFQILSRFAFLGIIPRQLNDLFNKEPAILVS